MSDIARVVDVSVVFEAIEELLLDPGTAVPLEIQVSDGRIIHCRIVEKPGDHELFEHPDRLPDRVAELESDGRPFFTRHGNSEWRKWVMGWPAENVGVLAQKIAVGHSPIFYGDDRVITKGSLPEGGLNVDTYAIPKPTFDAVLAAAMRMAIEDRPCVITWGEHLENIDLWTTEGDFSNEPEQLYAE